MTGNSNLLQWRPTSRNTAITTVVLFLFLFATTLSVFMGWFDVSKFYSSGFPLKTQSLNNPNLPLTCGNQTIQTCPMSEYPITSISNRTTSGDMCPSYFRWIHEDLRPWKDTGITKEMVDLAWKSANFRLVIVNGTAYVDKKMWMGVYQTRDIFTWWGILQLLRRYPGRLPDLDLMFECGDKPLIPIRNFRGGGGGPDDDASRPPPPPLFRYCSDDESLDISFPDWSFWGWGEVNIRPWTNLLGDIKEGRKKMKWEKRKPYAYWKGNPNSKSRWNLMKCKVNVISDWGARLYTTNWDKAIKRGFKTTKLQDQCKHRYKIYIDGQAWSVSEKYILACDSMTLYVKSQYTDFFSRGLEPLQHYWPIRDDKNMCPSIKFAVNWGNAHPDKVEAVGKAAVKFIEEDLKMDYVYDYMFHLLSGYAKLLKFKPEVPQGAMKLCPESIACSQKGRWREFMAESFVASPAENAPCTMPPPFSTAEMREVIEKKANATKKVEMWEKNGKD